MLKLVKFVVPLGVVLIAIAVSNADKDSTDKSNKESAVASKSCQQCDAECSQCQPCAVGKAMEALPKLVYKIGDESTTSPVQAGRIARKTKHKIQFTVQDKVFKEEAVAFAALVDMTEQFVADFAKPRKCEESGSTIVAGKSLCCDVAAGEVAGLVQKAMDNVKVTYMVGKETVCCPDAAKALAKESSEKVIQLVAGQKCGGCSSTTRLNLARAKYKAAIEALLAADQENSETNAEAKATDDTVNKVTAS